MNAPPIRCGELVRVRADAVDIRRGQTGTVVWVDRTSPNWTLAHVVWHRGGAGRIQLDKLERVPT